MKNVLYVLLPLLVITLMVWFIAKWGLNPRAVGVMKPSFFDQPEELGAVLYRRFFVELESSPVVVWGTQSQSPEHLAVVAGFLAQGADQPRQVIIDEELAWSGGPQFDGAQVLDFQSQYDELKKVIEATIPEGQPVLLVTRYAYSAQKVGMNTLAKDLREELGVPLFTITHLPMATNADQEGELFPQCTVMNDKGLSELGCLALAKSRSIYRKAPKFPSGQWVAVADQWPGHDLFVYWRYLP